MKILFLSISTLLLASCAALSAGSSERPNSYQDMQTGQQQQSTKDPYNYLDPTIGAKPPKPADSPKPCIKTCGAGERCDASGPVERCVEDTRAKQ